MMDLPPELQSVFEHLSAAFYGFEENPWGSGTGGSIIEAFFPAGDSPGVNVIPGGVRGPCRPMLVVALGSNDPDHMLGDRLKEAVEHVRKKCKETELVVFCAMWWSAREWALCRWEFRQLGIRCVLMMPYIEPQELR